MLLHSLAEALKRRRDEEQTMTTHNGTVAVTDKHLKLKMTCNIGILLEQPTETTTGEGFEHALLGRNLALNSDAPHTLRKHAYSNILKI